MRKSELRKQVDNYCRHCHSGSYRNKKHRYFVLHKIIRDLFHIGPVPAKWHALTRAHIQQLISHWKKENRKPATIMKYMTVMRNFLQDIEHFIDDIGNPSLGIIRQKYHKKSTLIIQNTSQKIANPLAKILFEFQVNFGLTFSEAMRLCPDIHIQDNALWITRDIASNSQDRLIPLRSDKQAKVIQSFLILCKQEHNLMATYGYHALRHIYTSELKTAKLAPSKTYRYLYAKNLHAELGKTLSRYRTQQTIMREMGLRSRRTLWGYLHESC